MHQLQDKEITTSKDRQCEWCAELVSQGERCRYRVYVNEDDDFCVGHQHPGCYTAMLEAPHYVAASWDRGSFYRGRSESR